VSGFRERYGPFALVAGASAGLGEAFARELAARGLNLLLLARRGDALAALARDLSDRAGVEVHFAAADLASPNVGEVARSLAAGREVGLLVYNAAHSAIGPFVERPLGEQLRVLDVNCRGPLVLSHLFGSEMARRGRGGILLMTSLAASQGGPLLASYAASKAFNLVLAEGLWDELGRSGVDVLACRAGATRTPGYEASRPQREMPLMEARDVATEALAALGKGPSVVAGAMNKLVAFLFARLLPRRAAIRIMGGATRRLYG